MICVLLLYKQQNGALYLMFNVFFWAIMEYEYETQNKENVIISQMASNLYSEHRWWI